MIGMFQFTEACDGDDRWILDRWVDWFIKRGIRAELRPIGGGVAVFREGIAHHYDVMAKKCKTPGCSCSQWVGPRISIRRELHDKEIM